jgi:hypothetical protein
VKGEASAVTRSRRENLDTIKQCDGIWNWEWKEHVIKNSFCHNMPLQSTYNT